jgi:DNA-binding MarR family transcriptional regulator
MTPIESHKFMQTKKMDIKALMILELLSKRVSPVMTHTLVIEAAQENISSPATTYKYLERMKGRAYVKEVILKDQDNRCTFIAVTEEGKKLLRAWQ